MRRFAAALALLVSVSTAAAAQAPGDWVLAQWRGNSYWYPGIVESRSGNMVTIRYDDGTRETRPVNQVRPYDWRVGSAITCQWTDGNWYDATITYMDADGYTIDILYEDGSTQRTRTARCRTD